MILKDFHLNETNNWWFTKRTSLDIDHEQI